MKIEIKLEEGDMREALMAHCRSLGYYPSSVRFAHSGSGEQRDPISYRADIVCDIKNADPQRGSFAKAAHDALTSKPT